MNSLGQRPFPIQLEKGGNLFGFCPAKATWDPAASQMFKILYLASQQKALLYSGGLADQPDWFVEMLAWFAPQFDSMMFTSKAKQVLGDGDKMKKGTAGKSKDLMKKPRG